MIAEIENALLERVREIIAPLGLVADALPDAPDGYAMTHQKGAVLVCNRGSRYDAPETTGRPIQRRTLTYDLTLLVRNLRHHEGAYEAIDALATGLAGWKTDWSITGARLVEDGFQRRRAGVWEWDVTVEIPVYLIPPPPKPKEPWGGAPIKSVTLKSQTGEGIVVGERDG